MKPSSTATCSIRLRINGCDRYVDGRTSVAGLLDQLQISNPAIAIEVNGVLVSRHDYPATILRTDDHIEIVTLTGGG